MTITESQTQGRYHGDLLRHICWQTRQDRIATEAALIVSTAQWQAVQR